MLFCRLHWSSHSQHIMTSHSCRPRQPLSSRTRFKFHMSSVAFQQFQILENTLSSHRTSTALDKWTYLWTGQIFSSHKTYARMMGGKKVKPTFMLMWKSKRQPKQNFFFWLIMRDKLNTKSVLRKEHGIGLVLMRKLYHPKRRDAIPSVLNCNFAKRWWDLIEVIAPCLMSTRS